MNGDRDPTRPKIASALIRTQKFENEQHILSAYKKLGDKKFIGSEHQQHKTFKKYISFFHFTLATYPKTMTRYSRKPGARSKKKGFKKSLGTKRRPRDLDQIQEELKTTLKSEQFKESRKVFDPDLPGGGLHYSVESGKYFVDADALAAHKKTKGYKKRLKLLKEKQYTQAEADQAAGLGTESYVPWSDKEKAGQ